jgi:hypothetical protein
MSDTAVETNTPAEQAPIETPKPTKEKAQPHDCLCSTFLLLDPQDADTKFDTECKSTTMRVFAQGHDARLVSFLVGGHFDGYSIAQDAQGGRVLFDNPGHAAASVSDALGEKADRAVANEKAKREAKDTKDKERQAAKDAKVAEKAKAKADKEAAKAAAKSEAKPPREVPVKIAKEIPPVDNTPIVPAVGDHLIVKVGRGEYEGDVEAGTGELDGKLVVRYRNLKGEEEVRDVELTRVRRRA